MLMTDEHCTNIMRSQSGVPDSDVSNNTNNQSTSGVNGSKDVQSINNGSDLSGGQQQSGINKLAVDVEQTKGESQCISPSHEVVQDEDPNDTELSNISLHQIADNQDAPIGEKILKREHSPPFSGGEGGVSYTFPPPASKPVLPKYVVRPGPVPPPPKYVLTEFGTHHTLDHTIWMYVFRFLDRLGLVRCIRVCKTWNRWCLEPHLWHTIDLSRRKICRNHLVGLVRRQPRVLQLSDTIISRKQLAWLLARLPHLKGLNLYHNTWAAVNAVCSSACPLLERLDLSWVNGIWDDCIRDLVLPPGDHRPGVDESVSRLRRCTELRITGTNITDQTLEVLATYMPRLATLDVGFCSGITKKGLELLSDANAVTRLSLLELRLNCLNQLYDDSLIVLADLPNLRTVDLSDCPNVTKQGCLAFIAAVPHRKYIMADNLRLVVDES